MILLPINVFLFVDHFNMSYKEITFAQIICFNLGLIMFSSFAGRIFDHYKVVKATGIYFLSLAFYPALLLFALVVHSKSSVFIAFFIYGVAMSGVVQSWMLSSIKFSGDKDSSTFMGIHVTAVGIRSIIGPSIGVLIAKQLSMISVFAIAIGLFLTAGYLMFKLKLSPSLSKSI